MRARAPVSRRSNSPKTARGSFSILLKVITIFSPLRIFVPISAASLLLGVVYGLLNFAMWGRIPNGAVILILFAVIVFLVGLISEQISSLRFDGRSRL